MAPSPGSAAVVDTAAADRPAHRRHRWWGIACLMSGAAVLAAAALWISHDQANATTFGEPLATATGGVPQLPQDADTTATTTAAATTSAGGLIAATGGAVTVSAAPVVNAGPPTGLIIRALSVDAPVDEAFSDGRVLPPPDDPTRIGWWVGSAPVGVDQGSIVLVGHVDSAGRGPGALFRLNDIDPGAQIIVRAADGTTEQFDVTARTVYPKTGDLPADLFRVTGPHQLILITCGGDFDETTKSYAENIVVTAAPTV